MKKILLTRTAVASLTKSSALSAAIIFMVMITMGHLGVCNETAQKDSGALTSTKAPEKGTGEKSSEKDLAETFKDKAEPGNVEPERVAIFTSPPSPFYG